MNAWTYQIYNKDNTGETLLEDKGFETEDDAYLQGTMEANACGLKNWNIRTFQEWIDI